MKFTVLKTVSAAVGPSGNRSNSNEGRCRQQEKEEDSGTKKLPSDKEK